MDEKPTQGRSGGIDIYGSIGSIGTAVARDMIVNSVTTYEAAFQPVADAVSTAPPDRKAVAEAKLTELRQEAGKGKGVADDGVMAKLVTGLVGLVPGAVGAIVSAFATPVLGGIAGPATKYVLDEIQGK